MPLACILAAVLLANSPALLHLVTNNPLVLDAALAPKSSGWLPGLPYIDGNAGFTMQALGHLAALDWLHGHIPWWNPYEGVGAPLAGEMQSGAFFPPTLLLAFHQGVLMTQLVIEAITGWSTYFLVRRLRVGRSFSTAAGVAFGLCGTYAWLAHAPIRPVAFLPLCLIGVERAVDAARDDRPGGWRLLAVALALSILAGFPETTLIDGLFVTWWAVLRVAGPGRSVWGPVVTRLAGGGLVGAALAAPLLVAFADYLPYGFVGGHSGAVAHASLPSAGLVTLILPYSLGPIFGFHLPAGVPDTITGTWAYVGGFLSVTTIAMALVGVIGRRQRLLRIGLGGWIVVCLLRSFGFPPVVHLMAAVPGVRITAFYRYSDPSWELAVVVLAALGLDDVARHLTRSRMLIAAASVTATLGVWAAAAAWRLMNEAVVTSADHFGSGRPYPLASVGFALIALALLVAGGVLAGRRSRTTDEMTSEGESAAFSLRRRTGRLVMAGAVGIESILLFTFTSQSAPPQVPLHTGSVLWLQSHLGDYRFLTLGPIQPNYGSYFGISQANINDLPVPKAWNNEISTALDPNALPGVFSGGGRIDPAGPTPAQELSAHLANYEAVGVRYVVENASGMDVQGNPFPAPGTGPWPAGPRLVYKDSFAEIWQLADAAPIFSLTPFPRRPSNGIPSKLPASCHVKTEGFNRAAVRCSIPTTLTRRVLYTPGWSASSSATSVMIERDYRSSPGLFQSVRIPAGSMTIRFTYLPSYEFVASLLTGISALAILLSVGVSFRRRPRIARTNTLASGRRKHSRSDRNCRPRHSEN